MAEPSIAIQSNGVAVPLQPPHQNTMPQRPQPPAPALPILSLPNPRGTSAVHRTLASTANLANLLPTGTVLAFQALMPSFSNSGACHLANKYLTGFLVFFCAAACFLSSFTDSFMGDGKVYHGIATFKGFYVFNGDPAAEEDSDDNGDVRDHHREGWRKELLAKYRIRVIDFVHAVVSLIVFIMFALGDADVLKCYFREAVADRSALVTNLPLGAGILASFVFMLFPTTRRGIGYADNVGHRV